MEAKKSAKADLQNKKGIFLEIGLCVSITLMLLLFSWSSGKIVLEEVSDDRAVIEEELAEFTREEITPPEPVVQEQVVIADLISVVSNSRQIESSLTFGEFGDNMTDITFVPATSSATEEAVEEDAPFITVSDMPKFNGGELSEFRNWVQTQLNGNYPVVAAENGIQGRVTVMFVIERDGSLTNIQVLSSPDRSLSEAATRVLQSSPRWTPGSNRGTPVRVRFTLPVDFRLE